jgi:hypothetical protein
MYVSCSGYIPHSLVLTNNLFYGFLLLSLCIPVMEMQIRQFVGCFYNSNFSFEFTSRIYGTLC